MPRRARCGLIESSLQDVVRARSRRTQDSRWSRAVADAGIGANTTIFTFVNAVLLHAAAVSPSRSPRHAPTSRRIGRRPSHRPPPQLPRGAHGRARSRPSRSFSRSRQRPRARRCRAGSRRATTPPSSRPRVTPPSAAQFTAADAMPDGSLWRSSATDSGNAVSAESRRRSSVGGSWSVDGSRLQSSYRPARSAAGTDRARCLHPARHRSRQSGRSGSRSFDCFERLSPGDHAMDARAGGSGASPTQSARESPLDRGYGVSFRPSRYLVLEGRQALRLLIDGRRDRAAPCVRECGRPADGARCRRRRSCRPNSLGAHGPAGPTARHREPRSLRRSRGPARGGLVDQRGSSR